MKHTKGPWRFNSDRTALLSLNSKNEYTPIFDLNIKNQLEPSISDAQLIAAAPEMLEALKQLQNKSELGIYVQDWIGSVIAKAQGGDK